MGPLTVEPTHSCPRITLGLTDPMPRATGSKVPDLLEDMRTPGPHAPCLTRGTFLSMLSHRRLKELDDARAAAPLASLSSIADPLLYLKRLSGAPLFVNIRAGTDFLFPLCRVRFARVSCL